jgi:hypothetical protein
MDEPMKSTFEESMTLTIDGEESSFTNSITVSAFPK